MPRAVNPNPTKRGNGVAVARRENKNKNGKQAHHGEDEVVVERNEDGDEKVLDANDGPDVYLEIVLAEAVEARGGLHELPIGALGEGLVPHRDEERAEVVADLEEEVLAEGWHPLVTQRSTTQVTQLLLPQRSLN